MRTAKPNGEVTKLVLRGCDKIGLRGRQIRSEEGWQNRFEGVTKQDLGCDKSGLRGVTKQVNKVTICHPIIK